MDIEFENAKDYFSLVRERYSKDYLAFEEGQLNINLIYK